jgi:bifunctional non-homologous end joining protein LigD
MSTIAAEPSVAPTPSPLPDVVPVPFIPRALPFDDPGWVFHLRHEGLRGFAVWNGPLCEIRSARELRRDRLSELSQRVAAVLGCRDAVLDGDVVALARDGRPSLRELLRGQTLLAFSAFDLLWLDGEDLRRLPLEERLGRLASLLPEDTGPLYKSFTLREHGRALFAAARRLELEGIVARRRQDSYGPDTAWYSIRNPGYTRDDGRIDPFRARPRTRRPDREASGS